MYFITEWSERVRADAQWLSLRQWICMHVVHRMHERRAAPMHSHHLIMSDGSIRAAEGLLDTSSAVGAVATKHTIAPGGAGSVPQLGALQEVMHAPAEVGFSTSVQATAIMDCTLSGVLKVRWNCSV